MVYKTLNLKLHNPSKAKQHIMDEAMLRYAKALQTLLDVVMEKPELKSVRSSNGSLRTQIASLIDKNLLKSLNEFHAQPFKDSLKIEVINLVENFLKRRAKNHRASFPRVTLNHAEFCEKINNQRENAISQNALDKLCNKLDSGKTVYFCRYSDCRDYALLYDPYKKRFYAKLYLLSQKDVLKLQPKKSLDSYLQVVGKNKFLPYTNRPERYIIVPLSFGKEQEKLLQKALERPEILKTARLLKKNGAYYLNVNVAIESDKELETKGYAGFCASSDGKIRYTVCGLQGDIIHQGILPCGEVEKPVPMARDRLHILSNAITDVCLNYQAQAVMETYPLYNQLITLLEYKLPLNGLQKPVRVSPFGLVHTCPRCGSNCKKKSAMGIVFLCAACGFAVDRMLLPSYNLAKRLIKYQSDKVIFHIEPGPHGNERIIKNRLLNLEYPITVNQSLEDFFSFVKIRTDQLKEQLKNQESGWTREDKKQYSLWNKLFTAKDIRDVIEIEV